MDNAAKSRFEPTSTDAAFCTNDSYRCLVVLLDQADITFVPVKNGFLCLVAVMDWAARKMLSWRLSNTMHADFCVEVLKEAIAKHGSPEIMNTD